MPRHSNSVSRAIDDDAVLDAKPIRSLSPLFPAPSGCTTTSSSSAPPLVYVTPFTPFSSGSASGFPSGFTPSTFPPFANSPSVVPPFATPQSTRASPASNGAAHVGLNSNGPLHATPLSSSFQTPPTMATPLNVVDNSFTSASGRKIKQPMHLSGYSVTDSDKEDSDGKKAARKRPKKMPAQDIIVLPTSQDPRESVEMILMTFDALRRRILQVDETKETGKRPDLRASAIMMSSDLRVNKSKRIGPVPGIEIGDMFYFRMELCLVGLHAPSMGGIDYMITSHDNQDDPIAVSVVSAGGYENDDDDVDVLVYSGQGGNSKDDQKLERGNLALERSLHRANQIRVIRGAKDLNVVNGRIYIYDGLYKVHESWVEKGKSGFKVFKYKFVREPGQPDGIAVWKMTQKWIENPSSRGRVILPDISSGAENVPVCLVNDVDNEKGPSHFQYATKVKYLRPINSMKPLQGCSCLSVCLPDDKHCSCADHNGGQLPYSSSGFLIRRKRIIYECNTSCQCTLNCRNRVTQKGVRLHFEIFKTKDRGWGLRSWDPIRAGTFLCEYIGEVIDENKLNNHGEEDEYIFQTSHVDDKTLKWNYGPELLGESSADTADEVLKSFPIIISAKNIGNISRFMNHSCSPNVFWQPVQHDHCDEGYPHIMFFAIKHIPPMVELTYDYGTRGLGLGRPKKCLCDSPKCRGYFG